MVVVVVVVAVTEEAVAHQAQTYLQHAVQIGPRLIVDRASCASGKYGTTACSNAQQGPFAPQTM